MTGSQKHTDIEVIVASLKTEAGDLGLDEPRSRLFIATVRELAKGEPVTRERLAELGDKLGLTLKDAIEAIDWFAEKDDAGLIVGIGGLSLKKWSHSLTVGGHDFSTWCAYDTIYLPKVLGDTAEVRSEDPVDGSPVRATVGPDGVEHHEPDAAVISMVIPQTKTKDISSAEQIRMAFCNYSLYFANHENAVSWFEDKSVDPLILSLDEAYEVAAKWFESTLQFA